ncbi:hypothetical protein MSPP1_000548b, partial [Malassezia sp. CBS 17886]
MCNSMHCLEAGAHSIAQKKNNTNPTSHIEFSKSACGHRFNIAEGQGCQPALYMTPVAITIDYAVPLAISVASLIYSLLALKHFISHKKEFDKSLSSSGQAITSTKFLRMISFALIDIIINLPAMVTLFALDVSYQKIKKYTSWGKVHSNFGRVFEFPSYALEGQVGRRFIATVEVSSWMLCASAIIFFALFGFSIDAKSDYISAHRFIRNLFSRNAQDDQEEDTFQTRHGDFSSNNSSDCDSIQTLATLVEQHDERGKETKANLTEAVVHNDLA